MNAAAWTFILDDGMTKSEPRTRVFPGQKLTVDQPIDLWSRGFHASVSAIDALFYAQGSQVCRVSLSGEIVQSNDKLSATEITYLWIADATKVLQEFACWCAETALHDLSKAAWDALKVKRAWIDGKATNEELDAAWYSAKAASMRPDASHIDKAAVMAAARVCAWDAAAYADLAAAKYAASSAAWSAVNSSSWAAVNASSPDDVRISQNKRLEQMLETLNPII